MKFYLLGTIHSKVTLTHVLEVVSVDILGEVLIVGVVSVVIVSISVVSVIVLLIRAGALAVSLIARPGTIVIAIVATVVLIGIVVASIGLVLQISALNNSVRVLHEPKLIHLIHMMLYSFTTDRRGLSHAQNRQKSKPRDLHCWFFGDRIAGWSSSRVAGSKMQ